MLTVRWKVNGSAMKLRLSMFSGCFLVTLTHHRALSLKSVDRFDNSSGMFAVHFHANCFSDSGTIALVLLNRIRGSSNFPWYGWTVHLPISRSTKSDLSHDNLRPISPEGFTLPFTSAVTWVPLVLPVVTVKALLSRLYSGAFSAVYLGSSS